MSDSGKAVFLSYASQDKDAARRIAEALQAAGLEVWFDVSELRGGDAWDQKIRRQIKECALFVPLISASTNARSEGYFRLEWKLAVDRSHLMADDAPFLFPISIGDVDDATARVPDKFREVQWTKLRLDETPGELATRVARLLSGDPEAGSMEQGGRSRRKDRGKSGLMRSWWLIFPLFGMTIALVQAIKGPSRRALPEPPAPPVATNPPAVSEARQLAQRARTMSLDRYSSTADDYAAAEGLLKRALALDENDAEIWAISSLFNTSIRTRGFDHAQVRRETARRDAERAVKLAPDSLLALFALGRAQRDFDAAAAVTTFKRILEQDPKHAEAMSQLAFIYDRIGKPDEAAALYEQVLVLDPKSMPLTRYVQFLLNFHYGRFPEAEASVRLSVAAEPSFNSVAGLAMLLLTWKGDGEGAAQALAKAPADYAEAPRFVWVSALVHLARRDPEAILRTTARFPANFIQDNWFSGPKAYFDGLAHELAGRHEAARVAWESALAIVDDRLKANPQYLDQRQIRGQLLAFLGRPEEARREARTLAELGAQREYGLWVTSEMLIYAALGDADAALPLLQRYLTWDRNTSSGWPLTPELVRLDPRWDKLRNDPRFQKLVAAEK